MKSSSVNFSLTRKRTNKTSKNGRTYVIRAIRRDVATGNPVEVYWNGRFWVAV